MNIARINEMSVCLEGGKKTIPSFEFLQTAASSRPVAATCSQDKESYVEQISPAYFLLPKLHLLNDSAITYALSQNELSM